MFGEMIIAATIASIAIVLVFNTSFFKIESDESFSEEELDLIKFYRESLKKKKLTKK